jgi:hypothetical protein
VRKEVRSLLGSLGEELEDVFRGFDAGPCVISPVHRPRLFLGDYHLVPGDHHLTKFSNLLAFPRD